MYTKYIICTSEVFSQKYFSMRVSLKKLLTVSNSKYTDIYKNIMLNIKYVRTKICHLFSEAIMFYTHYRYKPHTTSFFKTSHLHLRSEFQLCRSLKEFRVTFILKNSEVNSRRILYSKYKLLFESRFPPSPFAFDSTDFFIM